MLSEDRLSFEQFITPQTKLVQRLLSNAIARSLASRISHSPKNLLILMFDDLKRSENCYDTFTTITWERPMLIIRASATLHSNKQMLAERLPQYKRIPSA
jgi:hypothetical protein